MIPTNFEAIFSIFRFFLMASKMAIFRGFGPRHAAGLSERPNFFFAIVIWHPNERSVRVSALNSKILSFSTPFCVVHVDHSTLFTTSACRPLEHVDHYDTTTSIG